MGLKCKIIFQKPFFQWINGALNKSVSFKGMLQRCTFLQDNPAATIFFPSKLNNSKEICLKFRDMCGFNWLCKKPLIDYAQVKCGTS